MPADSPANVVLPSAQHIHWMKLDSDERALAEHEAQVSHLHLGTTALEEKIADLQAVLAVSKRALESATAHRDALLSDVRAQRSALPALRRMPDELLASIFAFNIAPSVQSGEFGHRVVDVIRARASFDAAATCKRWRRVAVNTSRLWTYVGFARLRASDESGVAFAFYVYTLLERSKTAVLNIIFELVDSDGLRHLAPLMDLLAAHITRWRSFHLRTTDSHSWPVVLDHFRGPAPKLEQLALVHRPGATGALVAFEWPVTIPRYISHGPNLEACWIENMPFAWDENRHGQTLGKVDYLCLMSSTLDSRLWSSLRTVPALEGLVLDVHSIPTQGPSGSTPIALDRLENLSLMMAGWTVLREFPDALHLPALVTLYIHTPVWRDLAAFCARVSSTLTDLTIESSAVMDAGDFAALRALANVADVQLVNCTVSPRLYDELRDGPDCMWPKLTSIAFDCVLHEPQTTAPLVELVYARAVHGAAGGAQDPAARAPRTIQSVTFLGSHDVPRPEVAEIQYVLKPGL